MQQLAEVVERRGCRGGGGAGGIYDAMMVDLD